MPFWILKFRWAWQIQFLSHNLVTLKNYVFFKDLQMILVPYFHIPAVFQLMKNVFQLVFSFCKMKVLNDISNNEKLPFDLSSNSTMPCLDSNCNFESRQKLLMKQHSDCLFRYGCYLKIFRRRVVSKSCIFFVSSYVGCHTF